MWVQYRVGALVHPLVRGGVAGGSCLGQTVSSVNITFFTFSVSSSPRLSVPIGTVLARPRCKDAWTMLIAVLADLDTGYTDGLVLGVIPNPPNAKRDYSSERKGAFAIDTKSQRNSPQRLPQ